MRCVFSGMFFPAWRRCVFSGAHTYLLWVDFGHFMSAESDLGWFLTDPLFAFLFLNTPCRKGGWVRARPLHGRVKKIQFFEDFFNTLEAISYTHFVAKDSDSDSKIEELQRVDQPTNCANWLASPRLKPSPPQPTNCANWLAQQQLGPISVGMNFPSPTYGSWYL